MSAKYIKVLHAPDGADYFRALKDVFSHRPDICVDDNLADEPAIHQSVVFVFLLTPAALAATVLAARLQALYTNSFPILPVVERLADYQFNTLPEPLAPLRRLNAVGWYMDGTAPGTEVIKACERILGLGWSKQPGGVFVSYRRSDGQSVAERVYEHLDRKGYRVFRDTEDIEFGSDFQAEIYTALPERDFVLLVDSPDCANSPWVMKEICLALSKCIPVYVLRLQGSSGFPLLRDVPVLTWEDTDHTMLERVERFVMQGLAARHDFDLRVERTLRDAASLLHLTIEQSEKRRWWFSTPTDTVTKRKKYRWWFSLSTETISRRTLLEHENAPLSLDRLYRLHQGYLQAQPPVTLAGFIHNGKPLSALELEALQWARAEEPLEVLALEEVFSILQAFFYPAGNDPTVKREELAL